MRIHTNVLTEDDFTCAFSAAGLAPDVWVDECSQHASRKRQRGYNEHGWWMAELYKLDPEMIIGNIYYDINSFNERTRNEFA